MSLQNLTGGKCHMQMIALSKRNLSEHQIFSNPLSHKTKEIGLELNLEKIVSTDKTQLQHNIQIKGWKIDQVTDFV